MTTFLGLEPGVVRLGLAWVAVLSVVRLGDGEVLVLVVLEPAVAVAVGIVPDLEVKIF